MVIEYILPFKECHMILHSKLDVYKAGCQNWCNKTNVMMLLLICESQIITPAFKIDQVGLLQSDFPHANTIRI